MVFIFVIGVSCGIGKVVIEVVVKKGYSVWVMFCSGLLLVGVLVDIFKGNVLDCGDIDCVFVGIDIVVQVFGVLVFLKFIIGLIRLFLEVIRMLVLVMEKVGVNWFIVVIGFGVGDCVCVVNFLQCFFFKVFLGCVYVDKSCQEVMIEQSVLDWLIVWLGVLMIGLMLGCYWVLIELDSWCNGVILWVDVVDYIVLQLDVEQFG